MEIHQTLTSQTLQAPTQSHHFTQIFAEMPLAPTKKRVLRFILLSSLYPCVRLPGAWEREIVPPSCCCFLSLRNRFRLDSFRFLQIPSDSFRFDQIRSDSIRFVVFAGPRTPPPSAWVLAKGAKDQSLSPLFMCVVMCTFLGLETSTSKHFFTSI